MNGLRLAESVSTNTVRRDIVAGPSCPGKQAQALHFRKLPRVTQSIIYVR